jgi:hypothetical protein
MIFGRSSLPLEVAHGIRYELLVGVAGFLIAATATDSYDTSMGSLLLPLLATLNAFSSAFDKDFGGRGPAATIGCRSRVA